MERKGKREMYSANTKQFLRNAILMASASLFMRTVAVSFGASLSRRMGTEGMGLYSLVMSVYNFAVTFATSGVHLAVTRTVSASFAKGEHEKARAYVKHAMGYAFFFSAVASLVLLFGANAIGLRFLGDARTIPALRCLAISMIPLSLSTVMNGYFTARKKVSRNATVQVFEQFLRMSAVTLLLTYYLPRGLGYACVAIVMGGVIAEVGSFTLLLLEYLLDRRHYKGGYREKDHISILKTICSIAFPVAGSAYIRSGLLTVEHALIPTSIEKSGKTKTQALSDYGMLQGMALPIVLYPSAILYGVSGLLIPEFAERNAKGEESSIKRLCGKVLVYTALFGFGCAMLLYAFSRELGLLMYQSFDVGDFVGALALLLPVMFCDHVTDCILKGLGEQLWTMWVNICDAGLSILFVCLLLPRMGIWGYVWVILLAELFNFAFSFGRLLYVVKPRLSWQRLCFLPLASGLCGIAFTKWLLPMDAASSSLLWTILRMLFCLSVYIGLYIFLSALMPQSSPSCQTKSSCCLKTNQSTYTITKKM